MRSSNKVKVKDEGLYLMQRLTHPLTTGKAKSPEEKAHDAAVAADIAAGGDGTLGMSSVVGVLLVI